MTSIREPRRERRLEAAKGVYLARFGEDAPVSPYLDHRRLPDALLEAAEQGEPLTAEALAKWLGGPRPGRWSELEADPRDQLDGKRILLGLPSSQDLADTTPDLPEGAA